MKNLILAAAAVLALLGMTTAVQAQTNPFIGKWKLNTAKSKYSPGPALFQSRTSTYEAHGDGVKVSTEGVNGDGSHAAWGYTASYDGKDAPISGTGTPGGADTVAIKRINSNSTDTAFKKAGKVVASGRSVISADGKVMTITAKSTGADGKPQRLTLVYDKQ